MVEGLEHLVLDTNILLIDANNLIQKGKVVIVPETVIDEMDSKKSLIGSELGYQARAFSRLLSKAEVLGVTTKSKGTHTLSTVAPQVTETLLKINDCYVMFVAFSHYSTQEGFSYSNDRKILEVAKYYSVTKQAKFISNDNAARLRAISLGIVAEEFSIVEDIDVQFTREVVIENDLMFEMLNNKPVSQVIPDHRTGTYNYVVSNPNTSQVKLCFVDNNGMLIHLDSTIEKDIRKNVNIAPINTQQLFLARAIQDTTIPLVICEALAGSGKAQPLSEKVLTPSGWTTMKNINKGDFVIGSEGLPIQVLNVYPQGIREIYKVTFIDGTSVLCDKEHIWTVRSRSKGLYSKTIDLTVSEMLDTWVSKTTEDPRYGTQQIQYNYSIPVVKPCRFGDDSKLTLDPYLLGLLLGDGGFTQDAISFTNNSLEIVEHVKCILEVIGYSLSVKYIKGAYNCTIIKTTAEKPFKTILRELGLFGKYSYEKHIPKEYLNASLSAREHLYQGLINTDGYVINGKLDEYSTSSEQLAKDFLELGRSIGKVLSIKSRVPIYEHKGEKLEGKLSYRIRELKSKSNFKSIISIEYSHEEEAKCIYVDSNDHLYVTNGYNLTHNTLLTLSNGLRMVELGKYAGIVYIRHSVDDVPKEEEVGFLSGNDEKMAVYFHPLYDSIEVMVRGKHKSSKLKGKDFEDMIAAEVEKMITDHHIVPMTGLGLRGRTLTNQFVIIDEAQNPNSSSMQKTLTRIGKGCKVVVIGSNKQIDNPYSTKYTNGLSYLLNACKQENSIPVYGVDLHKVVRSDIAEFAEKLYSKEVK